MSFINERKLLLLGLLRQKDMHGYLLNAHLDSSIPITLKKPTAYNLLEMMEKDGWVTHHDEIVEGRTRKVYAITENGSIMFHKILKEQLSKFIPSEHPGMVSIGFLDTLPAKEALALLFDRRAQLEYYIEVFSTASDSQPPDGNHHHGSSGLLMDYSHRYLLLELQFLNEIITKLEES